MTNVRVFIGWDSKEPLAFAVAAHSILRRASRPVAIVPLALSSLQTIYTRERGPTESTEFSLTRFLVPYFSGYEGISLFVDCDVLVQADVYDLLAFPEAEPDKAVFCCQHDYIPKALTKFDGHEQTKYPRKNWSSCMLFNNDQCRALTPEYVNTATGIELHRFQWVKAVPLTCPLCGSTDKTYRKEPGWPRCKCKACGKVFDVPVGYESDGQIGSLPLEWNWLVGEYAPNPDAKILHYTNGIPAYPDYTDCDHADLWWAEYRELLKPAQAVESALKMVVVR